MRYYLDTEFDETPDHTVLLSLALRAEDGRELYLVSSDFNPDVCNPWVKENVLPHLCALSPGYVGPKNTFAPRIERFLAGDSSHEFWGYYSAYDWFLFCRLWGGMLLMPSCLPKVCYDLKQLADTLLPGVNFKEDNPPEHPKHNALADARWNNQLYRWVMMKATRNCGVDTFLQERYP